MYLCNTVMARNLKTLQWGRAVPERAVRICDKMQEPWSKRVNGHALICECISEIFLTWKEKNSFFWGVRGFPLIQKVRDAVFRDIISYYELLAC